MSARARSCANPVFLLSTGRSGSTLAQRVLNCHGALVVWGEHFGFVASLAAAATAMLNPEQRNYPRLGAENRGPDCLLPTLRDTAAPLEWVNPLAADEYLAGARDFLERYFGARMAPGMRWGFKEIRYNELPVMRGLRHLYPGARFVFVTRDPVEVVRSKVFAFVKENRWNALPPRQKRVRIRNMLKEVDQHYAVYAAFARACPGVSTELKYEALVAEPLREADRLLVHLQLDPAGFDRGLAERVMADVITSTRRDDALLGLIRDVRAEMA